MIQPLISIIIPVYNAEKYIEECLNSVLKQSFQNYEIIVVNDGSKDKSLQICQKIGQTDVRVRVFSTENQGVSHARNFGMKNANGHWIMFLDSDDYLTEECLERLAAYTETSAQEICGNYVTKNVQKLQAGSAFVKPEDVITMILDPVNHHTLPAFYHLESATLLGVWGKLFLRNVIEEHALCFDEKLKLSEDAFFHIRYLKKIENVLLLNDATFYYRENDASVTKNFKEEYVENRLYLFEQLKRHQICDAVFVCSTMLLMTADLEICMAQPKRKINEEKIKVFWKENRKLLLDTRGKKVSEGKWQNIVYKICVELFLWKLYDFAFVFLRLYGKIRA